MTRYEYMVKVFSVTDILGQIKFLNESGNDRWELKSVNQFESNVTMYLCRVASAKRITNKPNGFDFDSIYKEYPRKEGRTHGEISFNSQIDTEEKYNQLKQAIQNYKKHIINKNVESKYIMMFSTFMNRWKEWSRPDTGKVEVQREQPRLLPKYNEPAKVDPNFIANIMKGLKP